MSNILEYTINWMEVKQTSTGKTKADVTLEGDERKITMWGDFPGFSNLKPGSKVKGEVVTKVNGKFTNHTFFPERTDTRSKPSAPAWAKKDGAVQAAKITSDSVRESMAQKQEAIERSSVIRDSTLITVALINAYAAGKIIDSEKVKEDWQNWRKFFEGEFNDPGVPF